MPSKKVILIKLGGSVITNKEIPNQLRSEVAHRLVKEIAQAQRENPEVLFVVGHGQGSFAHVPASKYKTMDGFINEDSALGMAIVQDSAAQLNRHIVHMFLEEGLPAVSLLASNSLVTNNREAEVFFADVFEEYIKRGLFPVTGGDVIIDRGQGCTIWSTEEVLAFFAKEFVKRGWEVSQIIHVTEVAGFYDMQGKVVECITSSNWPSVQQSLHRTKGFDVTGGMGLKVEESLGLSKNGIHSKILSGLKEDNLYNALSGKSWLGTTIQ